LSVETTDPSLVGLHSFKLRVELADFPELSATVAIEVDFDVFVDAACHNTQFSFGDMSELENMYTMLESSTEKEYTIAEPLDEVSSETGQGTSVPHYCGERTYSLELKDFFQAKNLRVFDETRADFLPDPLPVSLSVDPGKSASILLAADLITDYKGKYQAELTVGLKDYPGLIQPAVLPLKFYIFDRCEHLVRVY